MLALIVAQAAATSQDKGSSTTALIIVAVITSASAVIGAYFAYRAQKKQTDVSSEGTEKATILQERDQLSHEWQALREFQTIQLQAARKEIGVLEAQIASLKHALEDKDVMLDERNETIFDLQHSSAKDHRDFVSEKKQLKQAYDDKVV